MSLYWQESEAAWETGSEQRNGTQESPEPSQNWFIQHFQISLFFPVTLFFFSFVLICCNFQQICLCSACWERETWPLCSLSHKGFCGSACHTRCSSSAEGHLHLSTLCLVACEETLQICNLLSCLEKSQSLFTRNVESLRFRGKNPHTDCHICSAPTSKDQIKLVIRWPFCTYSIKKWLVVVHWCHRRPLQEESSTEMSIRKEFILN